MKGENRWVHANRHGERCIEFLISASSSRIDTEREMRQRLRDSCVNQNSGLFNQNSFSQFPRSISLGWG